MAHELVGVDPTIEDFEIPMRDGVVLKADVYLPEAGYRGPVILLRTIYDKSSFQTQRMFDVKKALARGYGYVLADTRGRYASEGSFSIFRSDIEDGYDTIEYLAACDFCDGSVVMAGGSYLGATQWLAAISAPPSLKAIAPTLTSSDYNEGWTYFGGAYQFSFMLSWLLRNLGWNERDRRGLKNVIPEGYVEYEPNPEKRWMIQTTAAQAMPYVTPWLMHLPLAEIDPINEVFPIWQDWLDRPAYDDAFWATVSPERNIHKIQCPAFIVSGWYMHFLRGAYTGFNAMRMQAATESARNDTILKIGPWQNSFPAINNTHPGSLELGPAAGMAYEDELLDFYDSVLGRAEAKDIARVRYFTIGLNEWRESDVWPPRGTRHVPLYLRAGGKLSANRPDKDEAPDQTVYDPADPVPTLGGNTVPGVVPQGPQDHSSLEGRADCAVYVTEPLANDLEITGSVEMQLFAASSALSTDFTAMLGYVDPQDGRIINICDGIRRVKGVRSDEPITIEMLATSFLVKAGTRLHLRISHSNFPRFDRNLNTGLSGAWSTGMEKATNTIFHDSLRPSFLRISVPAACVDVARQL